MSIPFPATSRPLSIDAICTGLAHDQLASALDLHRIGVEPGMSIWMQSMASSTDLLICSKRTAGARRGED
ncbi:hypothetical protein CPB85DRAFT_1343566, partial [Mucidula mucida]